MPNWRRAFRLFSRSGLEPESRKLGRGAMAAIEKFLGSGLLRNDASRDHPKTLAFAGGFGQVEVRLPGFRGQTIRGPLVKGWEKGPDSRLQRIDKPGLSQYDYKLITIPQFMKRRPVLGPAPYCGICRICGIFRSSKPTEREAIPNRTQRRNKWQEATTSH